MDNRLSLAEQLMSQDSCILCHIDENEYENLFHVFNTLSTEDRGTIIWDKRNPIGGSNRVATQHEYVICHSKGNVKLQYLSLNRETIFKKADTLLKKHKGPSRRCHKEFKNWLKNEPKFSAGERAFSEIDENGQVYRKAHMGAGELRTDPKYFRKLRHPKTNKLCPIPETDGDIHQNLWTIC